MIQNDPEVLRAEDILRAQEASPREIFGLAMKLKDKKQFGYARKLLYRARQDSSINTDSKLVTRLRQQHALCTYKDPDLPTDLKFDRAFEILGQCDDLSTTRDQETLGIAGAISRTSGRLSARDPIWSGPSAFMSAAARRGLSAISDIRPSIRLSLLTSWQTKNWRRRAIPTLNPALPRLGSRKPEPYESRLSKRCRNLRRRRKTTS